jgi:aryl-alcohol dehydrogenase-like predicted oxidoreductase
MRYRRLGDSGLVVSAIGLGGATFGGGTPSGNSAIWGRLGLEETHAVVHAAREAGITLFDLADAHSGGLAEQLMGEIVRDFRSEVIIATKWGSDMLQREDVAWGSRRYVRQACEASLRRLGTDYVDLYQLHWPDPRTPLEETVAALDELVKEGKVRCLGHSHLTGWQIADADWTARAGNRTRFISAQNHYNLLERDVEMEVIPACRRFGVGLLTYFALGKGLLSGRYGRDNPPPPELRLGGRVIKGPIDDHVFDQLEALEGFAADRGHTLPELAIAYLLTEPSVSSVLAGASRPEHVHANVAAVEWELSESDRAALRQLLEVA